MGAADLPRGTIPDRFLHGTLVLLKAYKHTKFQLPSSISFHDKEEIPKFNVGLLAPRRTPYAETFVCGL